VSTDYIFDSHAMLVFFQKEKGSEVVYRRLKQIIKNNEQPLICVINLGEILYMTKRTFGEGKKIELLSRISQLSFNILSVPDDLVLMAADIKASYPLSYADCFVVACAIEQSAVIVTGYPEFKSIEHLAKVEWIR